MGTVTGLSTSAYALGPLGLPAPPDLTITAFIWAIVLAVFGGVGLGLLALAIGLAKAAALTRRRRGPEA